MQAVPGRVSVVSTEAMDRGGGGWESAGGSGACGETSGGKDGLATAPPPPDEMMRQPALESAQYAQCEQVKLGRIGIWTNTLDLQPAIKAQAAAQELERLGYAAIWFPESVRREAFSNAALLLAATS